MAASSALRFALRQSSLPISKAFGRRLCRRHNSAWQIQSVHLNAPLVACRHLHLTSIATTNNSTSTNPNDDTVDDSYHNIVKNTETASGASEQHEFQAETRMLLDIVAKSLYSEKEVFIRELISNASDALERHRYMSVTDPSPALRDQLDRALEVHIVTDKLNRTFTIQDTGVGMTKEELVANLGTIARSGSKAFLQELQAKQGSAANIIGQFGVGFYSCFMVADKVEVYTRSSTDPASGLKWISDGSGTYEISDAEGVQEGTKIILHLKRDCADYSDEDIIQGKLPYT